METTALWEVEACSSLREEWFPSPRALGAERAVSRATLQWPGWDLTSREAFISRESCMQGPRHVWKPLVRKAAPVRSPMRSGSTSGLTSRTALGCGRPAISEHCYGICHLHRPPLPKPTALLSPCPSGPGWTPTAFIQGDPALRGSEQGHRE